MLGTQNIPKKWGKLSDLFLTLYYYTMDFQFTINHSFSHLHPSSQRRQFIALMKLFNNILWEECFSGWRRRRAARVNELFQIPIPQSCHWKALRNREISQHMLMTYVRRITIPLLVYNPFTNVKQPHKTTSKKCKRKREGRRKLFCHISMTSS